MCPHSSFGGAEDSSAERLVGEKPHLPATVLIALDSYFKGGILASKISTFRVLALHIQMDVFGYKIIFIAWAALTAALSYDGPYRTEPSDPKLTLEGWTSVPTNVAGELLKRQTALPTICGYLNGDLRTTSLGNRKHRINFKQSSHLTVLPPCLVDSTRAIVGMAAVEVAPSPDQT